jgi:hypothetical protein
VLTRSVLPTVLLVTGLIAGGCGSSSDKSTPTFGCADLCADINKCPSTTTQIDCASVCTEVTASNTKASCSPSFDTMMTCVGQHQSEVCTIGQTGAQFSCTTDSLGYYACAKTYCTNNPTDAGCTALHQILPAFF